MVPTGGKGGSVEGGPCLSTYKHPRWLCPQVTPHYSYSAREALALALELLGFRFDFDRNSNKGGLAPSSFFACEDATKISSISGTVTGTRCEVVGRETNICKMTHFR